MNMQQFIRGLDHIDADLVDNYIIMKQQLQTAKARRRAVMLRYGAVAACLCVMLTAFIAIPLLTGQDTPPDGPPAVIPADTTTPQPTQTTTPPPVEGDPNAPPAVSFVESNIQLNGVTEKSIGTMPYNEEQDGVAASPGTFDISIVVEAKVKEILPYIYSVPDMKVNYYVIKLEIVDILRGEGLPTEIYYLYRGYDEHLFEGYDTFILSLSQIGIQNYALINKTTGSVDFFPHMFQTSGMGSPLFGSVIAFTNDTVDISFWKKPYIDTIEYKLNDYYPMKYPVEFMDANNYYPARITYTLEQTKENILNTLSYAESGGYTPGVRLTKDLTYYFTAEDIFISEEEKAFLEYVSPTDLNVFCYQIHNNWPFGLIYISYHRLINGFINYQESISVSVKRMGSALKITHIADEFPQTHTRFTEKDLAMTPDIGQVISSLDLDALVPPHITPDDTATLTYCEAAGYYKKADDKMYGVVRIMWVYTTAEPNIYLMDDLYYLYDSNGNASIMERDELRALLGDDGFIKEFPYEPFGIVVNI